MSTFRNAIPGLAFSLFLVACGGSSSSPPGTPDAGPGAPPEIEREQAGGDPGAIVRVGDLAYVTVGPRLTIWDLSNPAAPVMRGESEAFDAVLTGVTVLGANAYVSDRLDLKGHVHVIDVSTPAAPETLATIRLVAESEFSAPLGITSDATRVFVADQENGIAVLDVTDPAHPTVASIIGSPGTTAVQIVGPRLYGIGRSLLGDGFSIEAFDLGSAGLDSLGAAGFAGSNGLTINPDDLAVGVGIGGLLVVDLTDLANPVELFKDTQPKVIARTLAADAKAAWLPAVGGIYKIDLVARPPVLSGPTEMGSEGANAVVVNDGLVTAVTDRSRLLTVDVSGATPALRADVNVSLAADAISVHAIGDQLFVASGAGGLRTSRLHDLTPQGRGYVSDAPIDFEDVVVDGTTAYAADWFSGLRVYDVTDPANPLQVAELQTGGAPSAVAFADGKVYLGESTGGGALKVIDVSDPTKPALLGGITTQKVWDIVVQGTTVYTAEENLNGPGGLRIWDVSNPAAPKMLGEYTDCDSSAGVTVLGKTAVIGCGKVAEVIDVTNPAAPAKLGEWAIMPQPSSVWSVAGAGTRAYIGHDVGLTVIDVSDPAHPTLVTEKTTPYTIRGITLPFADRVVAAAGLGGVFQWKIP